MTSSRRTRLLAGLTAAVATTALAAVPNLASAPAAGAAVDPCGTSPSSIFTNCVFYDDFSGTALDEMKWRKAESSDAIPLHPFENCLREDQVTLASGKLKLTSKVLANPMTCYGSGATAFQTRLVGGLVTTDTKFAHTYGRIEFRAQLPANDSLSVSALWMHPDNNTYNPNGPIWPYNGEIDVLERFPGDPKTIHTSLHYADKSGAISWDTGDKNPGETLHSCTVATPQNFHTYSAQWTASRVRFYVDNVQCASLTWDPANLTPPQPFDQPFNLIANQFAQAVASTPALGSTRVTKVDWVKFWSY